MTNLLPQQTTQPRELKMWLACRTDIEMPIGKFGAQAGHAFVTAILHAIEKDPSVVADYMNNSQPKITVQVPDEAALERVRKECEDNNIPFGFIVDAGRTVFNGPTATTCAFGPCYRDELPSYLRRLRIF